MVAAKRFVPPEALVESILSGNCVAFVGAGFPGDAVPGWGSMLVDLATAHDRVFGRQIKRLLNRPGAFQYEMAGQLIKNAIGEILFEKRLAEAVNLRDGRTTDVEARRESLLSIPFHAILTTNFDRLLMPFGASESAAWANVLRQPLDWWRKSDWNKPGSGQARVLKLHGEANGKHRHLPVVLARSDYRKRIYEDAHYADRLKALLATKSVLFLGTSFTDAYMNELRSAVLAMLGHGRRGRPVAWAITDWRSALERDYFQKTEGIELLEYKAAGDRHDGFDRWLTAIAQATSPGGRFARLKPDARIVWYDPNVEGNEYGRDRITAGGVRVVVVKRISELTARAHGSADLIISRWGHRAHGPSEALELLELTSGWKNGRPPVIVFASGSHAAQNRRAAMRRGAYDYAHSWQHLFRLIEQVLTPPERL